MMDKPRDYCGVFGIADHPEAALYNYYGLHALQHRGQESAGIVSIYYDEDKEKNVMPNYKDFGLVLSVFNKPKIFKKILKGRSAIGHNRYSTSGSSKNPSNIQPFTVHYQLGNLAIGHNGNLSNAKQIREAFTRDGILFQSTSDTELILHLIAQSKKNKQIEQIIDAVEQLEGAFSLVILTDDALIAIRDSNGFKPLALGEKDGAYCVASETCAFDIIGAKYIRDINPGEILIIPNNAARNKILPENLKSFHIASKFGATSQCIFEYVYFSRPDSMIFGEMVDKIRRNLGKTLAKEHPIDEIVQKNTGSKPVIISVPDSSNTAAIGYASENQKMGFDCKYDIGLIRNHYVGRTFISPGQKSRQQKVRTKFNPVKGVIEGRSVIVVDDSIVRGTTSQNLIKMIRACNPAEIHFLVSSPAVVSPCYYGMDFPSPEELIANRFDRDIKKIAAEIGVDSLRYLSTDGLVHAVKEANPSGNDYCTACFTSKYPVPVKFGFQKDENELV